MSSPGPNPANPAFTPTKAHLSHLRHYANISYLTTHKSSASNDPTVRLPQAGATAAAQETHEKSVMREAEGLRERIKAEREVLRKLPAKRKPKSEKRTRLNDLLIDEHVYGKKLLEEIPPPGAPDPTSPLNPLLLHRFLSSEIERLVNTSIPLVRQELAEIKSKICSEEAEIKTTGLLASALRSRVEVLERGVRDRKNSGDEGGEENDEVEAAEKIIQELERRYTIYRKAQRKFLRELSKFVNTYLAKLLAAEKMGGPVVGDDLDIDVSSGVIFDKSGKVRREKGQRTIHDMLPSHKGKKRGHEDNGDDGGEEEREEVVEPNVQVAKEFKGLLEELMNKALEAEGYVVLEGGDSAAARFLVRSGVAVFHPRDARRMRLVEFGRSVED